MKKLIGAAPTINTCADNFIPIAPWRESSAFSGESRLVAAKLFGDYVETVVRPIQVRHRLTTCPRLTVVVFGCGPVGLFAQKCAWLLGAGRVIAVDHVDYRLEFAKRFSNVETVNFKEAPKGDVVSLLQKMTDGRGADVCIDAVGCEAEGSAAQHFLGVRAKLTAGSATAINWAISSVRKGGNVVLIGVYGPPFNAIDIGSAMNKGLTLRMNQANCKRYMPHLLEHIRAKRIDAKGIISHRFPLEAAPDAYEIFANKKDDCIKCVLIPPMAA